MVMKLILNLQKKLQFFDKMEQERRKKKKDEELEKFATEPDPDQARYPHSKEGGETKKDSKLVDESDSDSDSDMDDDKSDFIDKEPTHAVGIKKDAKTRTTIRNLRIREDTAKYLRNLDIDSAHYDPKSRTMKGNPTPHVKDAVYSGDDSFVRASSEVTKFSQFQAYAYNAYESGADVHMQAVPSKAELLFKQQREENQQTSKSNKESILSKYGGQEHLDGPKSMTLGQSEEYLEYRYDGSVIRGKDIGIPKSKYEEDILINNHIKIWGSYYEEGHWGYACCRNLVKNSYCTGKAGIAAKEQVNELTKEETIVPPTMINNLELEKKEIKFEKGDIQIEEKDERKRAYNSLMKHDQVSQEEIEAYQQKRKRSEDPMKDFIN